MRLGTFHARSREYTAVIALMMGVLVLSILLFPERAFQSSLNGLTIWWNIVFPSLLPFLMVGELMSGFGAVRGIGTLMEPLTRLLFRIPGVGAWAAALGAVGGMPAGAETVGKLRREQLVSREEGERILALSHVASPFFILTVVGAGFLQSVEAGAAIAIIHYVSATATVILMRRFGRRAAPGAYLPHSPPQDAQTNRKEARKPLLLRALTDMHNARLEDGRSFGKLLGDSVSSSIQSLMMIGGTMIVFSVLLGIMDTLGIANVMANIVSIAFPSLSAPVEAVRSALGGLLELHIGASRFSQLQVPDAAAAAWIGAVLAWSGLAVHVQVKTAIRHTDLRYRIFMLSRLIHAVLAFAITVVSWRFLIGLFRQAEQSFIAASSIVGARPELLAEQWTVWSSVPYRLFELAVMLAIITAVSSLLRLKR